MALKRVAVEFGMGTDLRGQDATKAAIRALKDALWHNSLNIAQALDLAPEDMIVDIRIGVPEPDRVDREAVAAILPYGRARVEVVDGGLEVASPGGQGATIAANAAVIVYFDLERVA